MTVKWSLSDVLAVAEKFHRDGQTDPRVGLR